MQISLDSYSAKFLIRSYQNGTFTVNDQQYQSTLLIDNNSLKTDELPLFSEVDQSFLSDIGIQNYEVVILGTGKELTFPEWEVIEHAQILGTPLEVMATDAACRTFTVLASEGRQVLALLYP
ncbi:MAG: hypothetical protein HWD86_06290 [Kangiellaceae bacterium]|nr:hypothetical protein [Kangiellaceae bacterium]